ncbi:MAG: transposase [Leptospiraceae bacterium]|nr:transposase [Leptospiraceae bacterium]
MRYSIGQWTNSRIILISWRSLLDNNLVENAIRPFVLGRKNWLFSGSPVGAFCKCILVFASSNC